jgi:hypothetical protein
LRVALKNERILVTKEILTGMYDTEHALRVCIDLDESDWGFDAFSGYEPVSTPGSSSVLLSQGMLRFKTLWKTDQRLARRELRNFSINRPDTTNLNHQNTIRRAFMGTMPAWPGRIMDSTGAANRM